MLLAGSDDGVYSLPDPFGTTDDTARLVLDAGRTYRVRQFPGVAGVFAATDTGLYHSPDGRAWTELPTPREAAYAVAAGPDGDRLYLGTRPAHVYVTDCPTGDAAGDRLAAAVEWRDCEGFLRLPSRDDWGLERHDDAAQVRSLHTHPTAPDRVVAGVEVGGVHRSDDRGETWRECRTGVDDDVHELVGADERTYLAATGHGLFRTDDAGDSWRRLDEAVEQSYVRSATVHEGTVYAGVAPGPSPTWAGGTDAVLLSARDGETRLVETPRPDELLIGWTAVGDRLLGATHAGTLLSLTDGEWSVVGSVPVTDGIRGRYISLSWLRS
jgi:hypothetical protein